MYAVSGEDSRPPINPWPALPGAGSQIEPSPDQILALRMLRERFRSPACSNTAATDSSVGYCGATANIGLSPASSPLLPQFRVHTFGKQSDDQMDELQSKTEENERLQNKLDSIEECLKNQSIHLVALQTELERVKSERENAVNRSHFYLSKLATSKNETLDMVTNHEIELNLSRAALENYKTFMIDLGIDKSKWMELEPTELANEYKGDQQQREDSLLRYGLVAGGGGIAIILLYLALAFCLLMKCWKTSIKPQRQIINPSESDKSSKRQLPEITNVVLLVFGPMQ